MTMERQVLHVYAPNRESLGRVALELGFTGPKQERDGLQFQPATLPDGEPVLYVAVLGPEGRGSLRRQVAIGTHLVMSRANATYPPQLAQLIGHDQGMAVFGHDGRPLTEIQPSENDKMAITRDLLIGLRALTDSHVIHRAICPESLFWDGLVLQIADFSSAAVLGTPKAAEPVDGAPWHSPEQAAGARPGTPTDDLYSAALVLFWLFTGERPDTDPAAMRARLSLQDAPLPDLLAGCFDDEPARRPTLRRMLERATPTPWRPPAQVRCAEKARADFTALRARQAADRSPLIDPAEAPAPRRPVWTPPHATPPSQDGTDRTGNRVERRRLVLTCAVGAIGVLVIVLAVLLAALLAAMGVPL